MWTHLFHTTQVNMHCIWKISVCLDDLNLADNLRLSDIHFQGKNLLFNFCKSCSMDRTHS